MMTTMSGTIEESQRERVFKNSSLRLKHKVEGSRLNVVTAEEVPGLTPTLQAPASFATKVAGTPSCCAQQAVH